MAEHSEVAYTTADGNDYLAHEQTYEGFIKLVKYGTAAVIIHCRHDGDFPDLIPHRAALWRESETFLLIPVPYRYPSPWK